MIGKEDVHGMGYSGMPHWYLKHKMKKARALVARFEGRLRA
jgi:hypothetical protein